MSKEEFAIPRAETLDPEFSRLCGRIQRAERRISRREQVEIRASSFPVCPAAYYIFRYTKPGNRPKYRETFVSEAATSQGTVMHAVLQKWFGIEAKDYCYGNWICRPCRKRRRHRVGIQICKVCGKEMEYEEYVVTPGKNIPFSGHIDMVMKMMSANFLVDFKGCYPEKIQRIKMSGRPEEKHYLQTNAYANAINLRSETNEFGGVKIDKITIIYIDRGRPNRLWHPIQVPVSQKLFQKTIGLIRRAKRSVKDSRLPEGLCIAPTDPHAIWCPWKEMCFNPLLETLLEDEPQPILKKT